MMPFAHRTLTLAAALTATLGGIATEAHAASLLRAPRPQAPLASHRENHGRLHHARELLGKHYRHSAVRAGERWPDVTPTIRQWTRRAMARLSPSQADAVARAIVAEGKRHALDPVFLAAVIRSESSFDPAARGTSGEIGLMQILPDTAKWIAAKNRIPWRGDKTLLDPVMNIRIGAAYFSLLRDQFDKHSRLYLSAYNMGPRNVERSLAKRVVPKQYAQRVMRNYVAFYSELGTRRAPAQAVKARASR